MSISRSVAGRLLVGNKSGVFGNAFVMVSRLHSPRFKAGKAERGHGPFWGAVLGWVTETRCAVREGTGDQRQKQKGADATLT